MDSKRREVYDYEKRFGDKAAQAAKSAIAVLEYFDRTGELPPHLQYNEPVLTSADRLAYYRSHGLTDCFDYPGGDAQFEADVLSGQERDEDITATGPLKKEDAYIIDRMNDGRFAYSGDFDVFWTRAEVMLAYYENAESRGFRFLSAIYPGGIPRLRRDVMSGEYARRKLAERNGSR